MTISNIQTILRQFGVDAWFLYDFRGSNSLAWTVLGLPEDTHCTRRWAVVIPAEGPAVKIVNAIEAHTLANVEADEIKYSTRFEWQKAVSDEIEKHPKIAVEYSQNCDLPVVSRVDGGTIEWLRSLGAEIQSSSDFAQYFTAVWSSEQLDENILTAKNVRESMMRGFRLVRSRILNNQKITEFDVQQEILTAFSEFQLITDYPPIVAVNSNAANPHYGPTADNFTEIQRGDTLLIDLWAKGNKPDSTFADITWMGFVGETVPERPAKLFSVIAAGRDAVVNHLKRNLSENTTIRGCELDDICRAVVNEAEFGEYFFHRTGHSITHEIHGSGMNLDNYETHDTRPILPMMSFSVEPGIYIAGEIGLRTELDVVINQNFEVLIPSEPVQAEILPILSPSVVLK